jgi:hypothetical protein
MSLLDRIQHGWNAFLGRDGPYQDARNYGEAYYTRPDRVRMTHGNERSTINAVFSRIAVDVSQIDILHIRLDEDDNFVEEIKDGLYNCLTLSANKDQTARAFKIDAAITLLNEGNIAIVPIDTTSDIRTGAFDIESMRVGKIVQWYPDYVRVKVYNDRTGHEQEITLPKSSVSIVENPFFAIMNEPNSTASRLIRKLNMLDTIDEKNSSGKLDMIIQLPYIIRTPARRQQAEQRRNDIEVQLSSSKYGIAYTDGTEKITQLNRSIDNNMMEQVEYFTNMLYSQLGITQSVLDGTADEKVMLNYYTRTIEPIVSAIVDEMKRKFLTKTARTQGQSIGFFKDPFKLVPVTELAELSDKLTRNCIMTSNEIRQKFLGLRPVKDDPQADQLINNNLSQPKEGLEVAETEEIDKKLSKKQSNSEENQNG